MTTLSMEGVRTGCGFWLTWVISSTLGWIVGFFSTFLLIGALAGESVLDTELGFMIGLSIVFTVGGTCLGTAQWLLLRRIFPRAGLWIAGSTLGFAVVAIAYFILMAMNVPEMVNNIIHNLLGGVVMGLVQVRVLQRYVRHAQWWVLVTAGGMLLAGFTDHLFNLMGIDSSIGAIAGSCLMAILTGSALLWLLSQNSVTAPKTDTAHA